MSTVVQLTPYLSLRPEDVSPELFQRFLSRFDRVGGNLKMIQDAANDAARMGRLVHFLKEEDTKIEHAIRFTYDMPLADMIAAGKYDYVCEHPYIPSEVEKTSGMIGEVRMPHLYETRVYRIEQLEEELAAKGLRSANFPELLLYGANNPDAQKQYTILCLVKGHGYGEMLGLYHKEKSAFAPKEFGRCLSSFSTGSSGEVPSGWRGFRKHHRIAVVRT
jgi:hypothetical protein